MKSILQALLAAGIFAADQTAFAQTTGGANEIAESYNSFGFKLLNQARESYPGKNVFLSPAGLGFALSMLADGAQGKTLREIRDVLQLTNAGMDLDSANKELLEHLLTLDPKIKLEIANSVWTAQDARIKPAYLDDLRKFYQAEAASVDFTDPATAQKINGWCGDHTHGKISEMVEPPIDPATRLILLDAVYFKGDWETPFQKKRTLDQPFTLGDGKIVKRPLMDRRGEFEYFENDDCQAVYLPYKSHAVSMYVFLPKKSLSDFLQKLTFENWQQWSTAFDSRRGTLEMPRFKIENSYDLNVVLKNLSMRAAFDSRKADFQGISDESLYVGSVKQKTYVDVNEHGTEAAAVTGIGVMASAVRMEGPPFRMIVNRPFFLAICDEKTGTILFMGAIVDPR
jgi:serpin B